MKSIKRFSFIFFAIVLLFSLVPFQAFAVDPVSAGVMANAFAQAIASYGAANGVAMTFDVSSTDGIGESVHELWKDFREGQQTADDYATIAQAIFPELYYKTSTVIGTASDVYAVGVHISDTYAETLDQFYNWLLSGPAEMVQVDNQYFEFSSAQIGESSVPLPVSSISLSSLNGYAVVPLPISIAANSYFHGNINGTLTNDVSSSSDAYAFYCLTTDYLELVVVSLSSSTITNVFTRSNGYTQTTSPSMGLQSGLYVCRVRTYANDHSYNGEYPQSITLPVYNGSYTDLSSIFGDLTSPVISTTEDVLGVKAYNPSGIADIPDTADPNYDALNRAKDIPLNIPWDDAIYGDGTGTLTDAQSGAIAGDLTQALVTDRTVELVEEDNPPAPGPDYSDVLLPLIPINVPSFNFSLSGIWHYVRSWVTSLGAWLSMMFSVWGILPYAIVVPVYACLVIVIVLGLYKRFFM